MKKKSKGGRPRKITRQIVEEVGEYMADGIPQDYACALVGVNASTFGPVVSRREDFREIMLLKHARYMARALKAIKEGGEEIIYRDASGAPEMDKDGVTKTRIRPWTGFAWVLERRYKPHFNRTEVHKPAESHGESGGLTMAEAAELEKMAKAMYVGAIESKGAKK
jgi:hypothetical protein